ncbi:MAG: alpha/beta hydrolase [Sphingomonadales bacterium]|nr:alpha/beta hydrolase [Sphingomonadales bacterium]
MALDAESRALLDALNLETAFQAENADIAAARAAYDRVFSAYALATEAPVQEGVDRADGPGGKIAIHLFNPDPTRAALPVTVFLHGGGWSMGGRASYAGLARALAAMAGHIVAVPDYRLAPEHPFPAPLEDAKAVLGWCCAGGPAEGDPTRVFVAGDSAGGNLAAAAALSLRGNPNAAIAGQVLAYPVLDLRAAADYHSRRQFGGGDHFLSTQGIGAAAAFYLGDAGTAEDPLASPILAPDISGLPPTLVLGAGHDPLRDEGKLFAGRLKAAGVPALHKEAETTIHGFLSFAGRLAAGRWGLGQAAAFLRRLA